MEDRWAYTDVDPFDSVEEPSKISIHSEDPVTDSSDSLCSAPEPKY